MSKCICSGFYGSENPLFIVCKSLSIPHPLSNCPMAALTLFKFRLPFFSLSTFPVKSPGCSSFYHSSKCSSQSLTAVIEMKMISILMEISFCYMFYSLNSTLVSLRWNFFHLPIEHQYLLETGCSCCYNFIIIHICTYLIFIERYVSGGIQTLKWKIYSLVYGIKLLFWSIFVIIKETQRQTMKCWILFIYHLLILEVFIKFSLY